MRILRPAKLNLIFAFVHSTAFAQEPHPLLTDEYQLWLGVYFPDMDSKISIAGSTHLPRREVEFEQPLIDASFSW